MIKTAILLFFALVFIPAELASAQMGVEQRRVLDSEIKYFNVEDSPVLSPCVSTASLNAGGSVYVIGDSITQGSATQIESQLSSAGFTSFVDGVSSRSLSTGDEPTNGLTVLANTASNYANAVSIVIALGTNGGPTSAAITEAIDTVRSANELADIYWVNIGVNNSLRSGDPLPADDWNAVIQEASQQHSFGVIDWASVVAEKPEIIADDGLGVHPNDEGKELFASAIVAGIQNASPTGPGCGTSSNCEGETNAEKVWNCMTAKGLQPFQVAGFMGNMQAEAGFEPRRVEYPHSGDPWSEADYPDYLSDTVPPCLTSQCRPGYGIVQWTAQSRKEGLTKFSQESGIIAGDLGLQIDYVWVEITGNECCRLKSSFRERYGDVSILDALLQTTTIEESVDLILRNYEIPADMDAAYVKRLGFAQAWLIEFGSGG